MINVTKNSETKLYKAVQDFKKLVKQNDGSQRNNDRSKIPERCEFLHKEYIGGEKKWKKTSISSLIKKNNKTVQHDKNQVTKFLDQHILQWGKGGVFV